MFILFLLAASIVFIILSTSKWNLHPFFSLLIAAFLFGLLSGIPASEVIQLMTDGFGSTIGKIGLIIILGILIGTFLENSGAAIFLAEKVLQVVGKKRIHTAIALIGYIISIPVFADSGFVILSSLNQAITRKAGISLAGTVVALALGLIATHTMVPPTPGPIAAAGIIEADLGIVFLVGVATSLFSLVISIFYARYIGKKIFIEARAIEKKVESTDNGVVSSPGLIKSIIPLALPVVLILLRSLAEYPGEPLGSNQFTEVIIFLGNPVAALFIGALFSLLLPSRLNKKMMGTEGWLGSALQSAAVIILITGAGGMFGYVLQNSGLDELFDHLVDYAGVGILIPFLLAAVLKTAQGSSTVALITTASIMAPLLPSLGLDGILDKAMVVVAIGAGSAVVSHVNDSFFWVVTQLSGFSVKQGYRIHTLGSGILGISAILFLIVVRLFTN